MLRDIADHGEFKIVLVSTPRILGSLDASGELLRRIDEVFFRRYRRDGTTGRKDYTYFRRIFKSLVERLPKQARFRPSSGQEALLHGGSLGCIGHLSSWLRRAVIRCDRAGANRLEWNHFEETCYSDKKLLELYGHVDDDDEVIHEWTQRTHCQTAPSEVAGTRELRPTPPEDPERAEKAPTSRSRSRRVGSQRPTRRAVG